MRNAIDSLIITLLLALAAPAAVKPEVADAAMQGDKAALRALLQKQADVNAPQNDGSTALHWAVRANDLEMAQLLLAAGARVSTANASGATPMLLATMNGNARMIDLLLKAGADPNAALSASGDTPLMLAARTGNVDAVK